MRYAEFITFEYAAAINRVNITVIEALGNKGYLKWKYEWGRRVTPSCAIIGLSSRWASVRDTADIADMETPRGMYNRVLKNQVRYIKAPEGGAFHIDGQKGLKILVNVNSIEPHCRR